MIALGVFLHAVGGWAAGSFYIPYKRVKEWAWESYWIIGGFFSWIVAPWVVVMLVAPEYMQILKEVPGKNLLGIYLCGLFWGIGGLTFGLSMRYLGMSLGYAIALGFCATFGTIIPPMYDGTFMQLFKSTSGMVTLSGVPVCLLGIVICALAGVWKEKDLNAEQQQETIKEFSLFKGICVAVFAGIMSACMAFAFKPAEPLAQATLAHNVRPIFANLTMWPIAFGGGFTTNFLWCMFLNIKNKSGKDYIKGGKWQLNNYIFSALAGFTWYLQFFFYGMGATQMGKYGFSSWTLHMAFIIVFSNIWALWFHEWKGARTRTLVTIILGIFVVFMSTIVVGIGNWLAASGK